MSRAQVLQMTSQERIFVLVYIACMQPEVFRQAMECLHREELAGSPVS